jgi:hypothetical protein
MTPPHKPPFQFGLAALFILTAGVAVLAALFALDPALFAWGLGGMLYGLGAFLAIAGVIALSYVIWRPDKH